MIRRRETENSRRYFATGLVLSFERLDEINEFLVLLEDREDVLLFVPFVVFLNKASDQLSGVVEDFGRNFLFVPKPPDGFLIDEKTTVEHTVFLHQVFRSSHPGIRIDLVGILLL